MIPESCPVDGAVRERRTVDGLTYWWCPFCRNYEPEN